MRLWVPHDERRAQPEPLATNDRAAYLAGIGLWLVVAIGVGITAAVGMLTEPTFAFATIGIGIALGVLGLIVVSRPRRRR